MNLRRGFLFFGCVVDCDVSQIKSKNSFPFFSPFRSLKFGEVPYIAVVFKFCLATAHAAF